MKILSIFVRMKVMGNPGILLKDLHKNSFAYRYSHWALTEWLRMFQRHTGKTELCGYLVSAGRRANIISAPNSLLVKPTGGYIIPALNPPPTQPNLNLP